MAGTWLMRIDHRDTEGGLGMKEAACRAAAAKARLPHRGDDTHDY